MAIYPHGTNFPLKPDLTEQAGFKASKVAQATNEWEQTPVARKGFIPHLAMRARPDGTWEGRPPDRALLAWA